jgi:CRP/FNR family transcriptional regulator, cyclic AMP receptor protein
MEEAVEARPESGIRAWDEAALLRLDPKLGAGLSVKQRKEARRELVVRVATVEPGAWPDELSAPGLFGVLVVKGALIRRIVAGPGQSLEVLTPGDLVRPWQEESGTFGDSWFSTLGESRLAVLDSEFADSIARWPPLLEALLERAIRRVRFLADQAALDSRVGMERRVLLTMWHLAKRCGNKTDDGVVVPLPLTHQMVSELVGAQRPGVSVALSRLTSAGMLARTEDRGWLLDPESENNHSG